MARTSGASARRFLVIAASVATSAASAQTTEQRTFTIEDLRYSGTGCSPNSVFAAPEPEQSSIFVSYLDYDVKAGRASSTGAKSETKSCALELDLVVEDGWSVAVNTLYARDGVDFSDTSVSGEQTVRYAFTDSRSPSTLAEFRVSGPINGTFDRQSQIPSGMFAWSPCGQSRFTLTVNSQRSVQASGSASGSYHGIFGDGPVTHYYGFTWRRCAAHQ